MVGTGFPPKLVVCGGVGPVLVAGICLFVFAQYFNLIFESGIGNEYFVGSPRDVHAMIKIKRSSL
jgi:hypothetical protein